MNNLKFLQIIGATLLFCTIGSTAYAANESKYMAPADNWSLICSYNQRDTVFFKPYSTKLIAPGESAKIGCNDGKPIFAKHKADSCRIRGIPSVQIEQLSTMNIFKNMVSAVSSGGSPSLLVKGMANMVSEDSSLAKSLCKNMMGVVNTMPYLGTVKSGSTVELNEKGMSIK